MLGWNGLLSFKIISGTDLPYCMAYFVCNNIGMYLKTHKRKKNGKVNEYYSIVEKRRVANGFYVQKTVLYLGEISDSQKKSWNKSVKVLNEQNKPIHKTLFALHDDDDIYENIDAIPLRLSGMKLEKPRAFGDCWLCCEIWNQLSLDTFWSCRIDTAKSPVAYSKVLKLLAVNRLIKPGSEFYVHHHWFDQTAMDFLRTNQSGKEAVELWQQYMLQCNVEQAFKELKSDLGIRPVYHHKEERVDAHIFVAFLSYCLQATLRQKLRNDASGLTSQAVLETLSRIQLLNVSIPTQDDRTLQMQRYTEAEVEHKLILEKLQLTLPPQSPPKIYSNQVNN